MKKIEYRRPEKKETHTLYRILSQAMNLERFIENEKLRDIFSRWLYLRIREDGAFTRVAEIRGTIIGFVAAKNRNRNRKTIGFYLKEKFTYVRLKLHKDGRRILKLWKELEDGCSGLWEKSDNTSGQISALWLSSVYHNKNIDLQLLKETENYFSKQNITRVGAVLNNFSDTEFYRKNDFRKVAEKEFMIEPNGQRFRLYCELHEKIIGQR